MDSVGTALAGLLTTVNPALQKLADLFCVSVDFIKEHAMEYIMMYGRYHLATNTIDNVLFAWGIISVIFGIIGGIWFLVFGVDAYDEEDAIEAKRKIKVFAKFTAFLMLGVAVLITICGVVPYLVSPEIYSIQAVYDLVNTK